MENKISIILNIYNLGFNYIKRSIDSIKKQTYDNFECLIIDDGSGDNFLYKEFFNNLVIDKRFRYFYHQNVGISISRNIGIKNATGDILFFLDGDDFLFDDFCLSHINDMFTKYKDIDILHYHHFIFKNIKQKIKKYNHHYDYCVQNNMNEMQLSFFEQMQSLKCAYNTNFIKNNNLFFQESRKRNEDVYFHLITKTMAKKIAFTNKQIFVYDRTREDSISNTENKFTIHKEFIDCIIAAYNFLKPGLDDMFFLYIIYYQIQFIYNDYKIEYFNKFLVDNYFIKNRIGISNFDLIINYVLRHKWLSKMSLYFFNNIWIRDMIKLLIRKTS